MGALHLLYAMKGQVTNKKAPSRGLMFVDLKINGRDTQAMIDTRATHNLITKSKARWLNLQLKDSSRIEAINSIARPINGIAKSVPMELGTWTGKTNLMVIPMDNFQVILGIEFLQDNKVVPMPYLESLFMLGETPCMIPVISKRDGNIMILALQLKKGLKKVELTYLAALKVETNEPS